ncbi:MAG: 3-deoxy-7-phosphoheptulonate synthase [Thermomicrobiales bacterium]|nr:MAG: 3-deoxy-7-phosphoheptulonate synthase [Thermomicrobiales bacterium]
MIVTIDKSASNGVIEALGAASVRSGSTMRVIDWNDGSLAVNVFGQIEPDVLAHPAITGIHHPVKPYRLASKEHRETTVVRLGNVEIGNGTPVIMAGPCVVSDVDQLVNAAEAVKAAGATILRGGAFKPRTSPYSFQGLGEDGLQILAGARALTGLPVVTEVMEPEQVEVTAAYADMLQIGARNMANFPLLRKVGKTRTPVLLKRGFSATIEEWLMSAEYILAEGNSQVVLCERGIRTFDNSMRFNLDLNAVPFLKELTHLPVVVDPSHGTGKRSLVASMAVAAIAAGADGLIIESEANPDSAKCDASQTIEPEQLALIVRKAIAISDLMKIDELAMV